MEEEQSRSKREERALVEEPEVREEDGQCCHQPRKTRKKLVDAAAERGVSSAAAYVERFGGGGGGEMDCSTEPMLRLEGLETDFWEGPSGTLSTSSYTTRGLSAFSSCWLLVELWWLSKPLCTRNQSNQGSYWKNQRNLTMMFLRLIRLRCTKFGVISRLST
ncbi:uncharacterized protein M6B38_272605 [Iris pallida]|uniref:Uncharacterized protein n=1 Tax=Iris pallida TaxID=29817 RepID=A0AAX6I8T4_IRIPA|nr:uncharacterized protein M6B38_272605 [Iris pallida]